MVFDKIAGSYYNNGIHEKGRRNMRKKVLWITETAIMLALLVVLQWLTKPLGQIVTGSCVNAVLAISVLFCGMGSGLTVALISPICAYLLGIAPQILTVPAIMIGNAAFVAVLRVAGGGSKVFWKNVTAWLAAAVCKFALLYVIVKYLICGVLAEGLMAQGLLKAPMLKMLPATFGAMQLVTALIGGAVALLMVPVLKKALHRN
jgi:hypothetical protein